MRSLVVMLFALGVACAPSLVPMDGALPVEAGAETSVVDAPAEPAEDAVLLADASGEAVAEDAGDADDGGPVPVCHQVDAGLCPSPCPTGISADCPGFVHGQVECARIRGARVCVRLCVTSDDCLAYGGTCQSIDVGAGISVRACVL